MPIHWNDTALQERIVKATMRGVVRATESVKAEAVSLILDTPKSGRTYVRRGVSHQASAPGEAPASDTGRLVNSIRTEYDTAALTGRVVASARYAAPLEYGTQKMKPRPFLRPALAAHQGEIVKTIQEEIAAELSKGA